MESDQDMPEVPERHEAEELRDAAAKAKTKANGPEQEDRGSEDDAGSEAG